MGACQSSISLSSVRHNDLDHVDDSIHILLKRDIEHAKKQGIELSGYRPRTPHPLLMEREKQQQRNMNMQAVVAEEVDFSSFIQKPTEKLGRSNTSHHYCSTSKTETESITERSIESASMGNHSHTKTSCRQAQSKEPANVINDEIENVLLHTKNHCDMIDPRDRRVYA